MIDQINYNVIYKLSNKNENNPNITPFFNFILISSLIFKIFKNLISYEQLLPYLMLFLNWLQELILVFYMNLYMYFSIAFY